MSGGGGSGRAGDSGRGGARETRVRLQRSRERLLQALAGATEADFRREFEGELLVERLADLARREREGAAAARRLLSGAAPAEPPEALPAGREATLPPQAIHALSGARHGSLRLLDDVEAPGRPGAGERALREALALLDAAAEREQRVAALIEQGL